MQFHHVRARAPHLDGPPVSHKASLSEESDTLVCNATSITDTAYSILLVRAMISEQTGGTEYHKRNLFCLGDAEHDEWIGWVIILVLNPLSEVISLQCGEYIDV